MTKNVSNIIVGVAALYHHGTPGTAAASIITEVGYTEDGVTWGYSKTDVGIKVEEDTFPVKWVLTDEDVIVTCNMAEASLTNLEKAIAGAVLAGSVITIGGGAIQEFAIKIVGPAPSGGTCTIYMPYVVPAGNVSMSYRKGSKTIVPVSFKPFRNAVGATICTVTYS